jgi:hypothetical protein
MDSEGAAYAHSSGYAGLALGEKSASFFPPDAVSSPQYFEDRRRKPLEPEERLVLAILEDAINCFQENHLARQGRRKRLFDEVRTWIFEPEHDWVFGFENICDVLGFDPGYIRDGLVRWRATKQRKHFLGEERRIEAQQAEIDRQQRELDRLKAQQAR